MFSSIKIKLFIFVCFTGKTLVSEILCLKGIIERRKKAIFVVPYKSMVREKARYFQVNILTFLHTLLHYLILGYYALTNKTRQFCLWLTDQKPLQSYKIHDGSCVIIFAVTQMKSTCMAWHVKNLFNTTHDKFSLILSFLESSFHIMRLQ
jgi:hypothetical protein